MSASLLEMSEDAQSTANLLVKVGFTWFFSYHFNLLNLPEAFVHFKVRSISLNISLLQHVFLADNPKQ